MSEQDITYLSYDEAVKIVAAIQEEEDIQRQDRRIFTVYNRENKEVCWFDYEEILTDVGDVPAGERKEAVQRYILSHIPDWALDI